MRIAGIIAEYNPFHNGHAYHIAETRKQTGCDYVVACMCGNMSQRGEITLLSRPERVLAALQNGADAVVELPTFFAVRTADIFAKGGVSILSALGCDILSFGCEEPDTSLLRRLAEMRDENDPSFRDSIQAALKKGESHARAWGNAAAQVLCIEPFRLNAPNLILGTEYIRAIDSVHSSMIPFPIKRVGSYSETTLPHSGYASASAIRSAPFAPETADHVPEATWTALQNADIPRQPDDLLLYRLREMTPKEIAMLPDVGEGLENRVWECARSASSRSDLISAIKCKRYTYARISRLCAHALLGVDRDAVSRHPVPEYIRLLGFRQDASPLIKELKERAALPFITRASELIGNEVFEFDCRATDLRSLCMSNPQNRKAGKELTEKFTLV